MKKIILDFVNKIHLGNMFIIAHADHDGICASAGLNYIFGNIKTEFSLAFRPKNVQVPKGTKLLIICDLLLTKEQINSFLSKGLKVINFDHHDVVEVVNDNYLCLNPKRIWGKQFISSSGLVWRLFKPEKIAWLLAAGSAGDLAIEDSVDLFEFVKKQNPELVDEVNLKSIFNSKLFEIAQTILMTFYTPQEGFSLVMDCINNGADYNLILNSDLHAKLLDKYSKIEDQVRYIKKIEHKDFVAIDTSDMEFSSSYSIFMQIRNNDTRVYIEYSKGKLFFRNYLGKRSILEIAEMFNGGGAHARAGGGYTKRSFSEVVKIIKTYFDKNQKLLSEFD